MKAEKYISISKCYFKQAYVYRMENILNIISSTFFVFIIYYLWKAVFKSQGNFNYLKLNETLTYVVIITIISKIISKNTELEVGEYVVSGNISVYLIKPINFFSYMIFNRIGYLLFNFIFSIIPLLSVAVFILKIDLRTSLLNIFVFILSVVFSFILIYIFEFLIGLTGFYTEQVFGISLLKVSLVNILAGLTVPLDFYPEYLQKILFNLPFQAMYYIPISIYLNLPHKTNYIQNILIKLGINNILLNLIIEQLIWIVCISFVTSIFWKVSKRKLVIQGG
jgi:ABC-2 type transport system permease protein